MIKKKDDFVQSKSSITLNASQFLINYILDSIYLVFCDRENNLAEEKTEEDREVV